MNLFTLRRYLRSTPFDTSNEQGRSEERYRLAILSMTANILSRGIAMVVMVLAVSLTLPYLGAERFGVWMTIASLVGMLTFLDLGVGNALTNKVAAVASKGNPDALCRTISGGLGILFILGIGMGIFLICISRLLPWSRLIQVSDVLLLEEVQNSATIFSILFGVQLFTNGLQRIFAGLQRSFESHIISASGSIVSLLSIIVATRLAAGIPILLILTLGIQSIAGLLLNYLLIKRELFYFRNITSNIKAESSNLFSAGGMFFLLQIGVMISSSADNLIISSQLGAERVATFAIVVKLFQFATQPIGIMNAPLWGAYADAYAKGETQYIKKTLRKSISITSVYSTVVVIILVVGGGRIISMWTNEKIEVSLGLLIACGGWAILESVGSAFAMFLNGCGIIRQQVITAVVFSGIAIAVKLFLIQACGLQAMVVGAALTYLIVTILAYGLIFRDKLVETLA